PSPAAEAAPLSACPQALQNFFAVGFLAPQLEHSATATSDAPQPPQKRAPSGFSSPQDRQIISVHGAYAHERGPCLRANARCALPGPAPVLPLSTGRGAATGNYLAPASDESRSSRATPGRVSELL